MTGTDDRVWGRPPLREVFNVLKQLQDADDWMRDAVAAKPEGETVQSHYLETGPVTYHVNKGEFSYTVPEDFSTLEEHIARWALARAMVEWVFQQRGHELNRWSLAGFYADFAGETIRVDRRHLTGDA